jgi:hypothetical protein
MDCGAAADHTRAGEKREDAGGGATTTGDTAGMDEAVSDPTQATRRLEWGTLQDDVNAESDCRL